MPIIEISYRQFLKTLLLIHMAITMSQLVLIVLIFVLVREENSSVDITTRNMIMIGTPTIILLLIFAGRFIYQQQLQKIRLKNELKVKILTYRNLHILHIAIIEAGSLFCFLAAFLSQNSVFVYGSIALTLYMLSLRPSKNKLENELQLDFNEQNKLSDPDFIIQTVNSRELD